MSAHLNISAIQEDMLKEIANVGSGNAVSALASMLNRQISISTGSVKITSISSIDEVLGNKGGPSIGIYSLLSGDLQGGSLIYFTQSDAFSLTDLLLEKSIGSTTVLTDEDRSMLKEVGLVLAAAYLDALGKMSGLAISPSVPNFVFSRSEEIAKTFQKDLEKKFSNSEKFVSLQTIFTQEEESLPGSFLIFLNDGSWQKLIKKLTAE